MGAPVTLAARLAWHVRVARMRRGWTQADLARALGWYEAAVQRLEAGDDVRLSRLEAVARALEVDARELIAPTPGGVTLRRRPGRPRVLR